MSKTQALSRTLSHELALEVRDACLCLHMQRAARALARHFDEVLRPAGLTNGQFSLLMSLNRLEPPTVGRVAAGLAMDRTTLTANLKPLERRGLVTVTVDAADKRNRRLALTLAGRAVLTAALPLWKSGHVAIDGILGAAGTDRLRSDLRRVSENPAGRG